MFLCCDHHDDGDSLGMNDDLVHQMLNKPKEGNTSHHTNQHIFFCWRLLGLIPGGTPFSQLNKGVRDAMSATTKRDVKHQVFAKTCKGPQVPTKSKHGAKNAESHEGTKKRAPVKSKGKHLCQSGKMQPKEEGFGETRRKHLCQSQKCALETRKVKGLNKL